jgi:segregation and condensation protein A
MAWIREAGRICSKPTTIERTVFRPGRNTMAPIMNYEVKTPVFEGPLDLLLQLITSHQVAITELNLGGLVAEYLRHLETMRQFDIEVTSEFLLIAATLIQLKARHLLPDDTAVDLDEELALMEERDKLLSRLLACLTFKDVAAVLAHRLEGTARFVGRFAGLDPGLVPPPPDIPLPVDAAGLAAVAQSVFARIEAEPEIDHLDLELPSVDLAIADLRQRMQESVVADFETLVEHAGRPIEVVAYFLALLELARWGVVRVSQDHAAAPIVVAHESTASAFDLQSEWST